MWLSVQIRLSPMIVLLNKVSKDVKKRAKVYDLELIKKSLIFIITDWNTPASRRLCFTFLLQALSRSASKTRLRNRCVITGRSRGLIRYFRLSRNIFKSFALDGKLYGVQKSSW
jgi:ribosomal protein S14